MRSEWPVLSLAEVAREVTVGHVGTMADQYVDEGVLFLRSLNVRPFAIDLNDVKYISAEFHAKLRKSTLRPGDVVIVRTGKPGTCAVVPEDLPIANCSDVVIVRCAENIRPHFLCYWVNAMAASHVSAHTVGAVQQHFNVASAKQLKLPVPSLFEQDAILEPLRAIDQRIDLLRQTNTTLESIAQALFKSWFTDFDPVRAKAEGREPKGMDAATAALFPAEFEESELGVIPKGWRMGSVREVCSIFDSRRIPLSGKERANKRGPYPYYGAAALMDHVDDFLFDGVYLLLGEDGSVTNADGTPVTQYVWGKFWVNNHAHVLQGAKGVCTEHLMLGVRDLNFTPYATGAVQAKLNQANLFRVPFLIPDVQVSKAFESAIVPLYEKLRGNAAQVQTLGELRDTLLPRLISGKLRMPEAEAQLEEAAE